MHNLLMMTAFLMSSINIPTQDIIPSGENIVFEIKTEGVIISGTYKVIIDDYSYDPLKDSDIRVGDIILEVNHIKVSSIKDFLDTLNSFSESDSVDLLLKRDKAKIGKKLKK